MGRSVLVELPESVRVDPEAATGVGEDEVGVLDVDERYRRVVGEGIFEIT